MQSGCEPESLLDANTAEPTGPFLERRRTPALGHQDHAFPGNTISADQAKDFVQIRRRYNDELKIGTAEADEGLKCLSDLSAVACISGGREFWRNVPLVYILGEFAVGDDGPVSLHLEGETPPLQGPDQRAEGDLLKERLPTSDDQVAAVEPRDAVPHLLQG